jgi:hypothetical protein
MPNLPEQAAANDKFDFPTNGAPEFNWGKLTSYAILDLDFDQGAHASDPTPDDDQPRVGLANVVEEGNIFATTELIEDILMV